jgi:hypothetical protein
VDALRAWLQTIAIIVAIIIFFAREILESERRRLASARKLSAIKMTLSRACELNHWTVVSLRRQLKKLQDSENEGTLSLEFRRNGQAIFVEKSEGGNGSSVVYDAHEEEMQRQLVPVAELDANIAERLEAAISGVAEMKHVRESMISYVLGEGATTANRRSGLLKSFSEYGLGEIDDTFKSLDALYQACTGKSLSAHRLR